MSLAPALAGSLILATGISLFDPLVALGICLMILVPAVRAILESREELIWPAAVACGEPDTGR